MKTRFLVVLIAILLISGCGSVYKYVPEKISNNNQYYNLSLIPDQYGFYLSIKNNTNHDIELLWEKTLFIDSAGGTNGLFTFGKENYYEDKDFKYPKTIIFPNTSIARTIYPIANRYFNRTWGWSKLNLGTNGILLTMLIDGKEVSEKMTFELVSEKRSLF